MKTKKKYQRIFTLNDPYGLRINREVACEIGFSESIVLLQVEFLISISDHEKDGKLWTYQSIRDLQSNYFPWWGKTTIARILDSLLEKKLPNPRAKTTITATSPAIDTAMTRSLNRVNSTWCELPDSPITTIV